MYARVALTDVRHWLTSLRTSTGTLITRWTQAKRHRVRTFPAGGQTVAAAVVNGTGTHVEARGAVALVTVRAGSAFSRALEES